MSTLDDLRTILTDDAELSALLTGGILSEPLTASTPGAWADPAAITGVRTLRPCAVILTPQEVDAPLALNPFRRVDVWSEPDVYLYAERSDLAVLDAADERIAELWHGTVIGTDEVTATGFRAATLPPDELPGDVWSFYRRYRIQRSWHIQEA